LAAAGRTVPRAGSPAGAASIADVLDRDLAADVLRAARARGGAFAELFVEERLGVSVHLDDGKVEEVTTGLDRGAGVRVGYGTSFGYAYSNRLDRGALLQAAEAAAASVSDGGPGAVVDLRTLEPPVVHSALVDASSIPTEQKVAWVREADEAARALGPEIVQVTATYGDSVQRVLVAASDGRWVDELRPRVRLSVNAVAARDGNIQTGFHGPAGLAGTELIDANPPAATAEVAARRAITMLDAAPAPAGETAVVLAPGMGGVLFHEAVGHPLEADIVDKEASVYRGRVGERLASEILDGVDDATVPNAWGSFSFDDEGAQAQRTVLFEDGVLQGWLYDRLRAEKDGVESSGNGRRQSYAHPPIPRMTNTYILNGSTTPEQIVADTERGVFVTALAGGQTNPATGDFVFGCAEAYVIDKGEVTTPVRGANLIGRAIEVMSSVDAIAADFDIWPGICGKDGQGVPVGSGSPTLRIARITVGGTGA
jgi:TldD protein